MTIPIVNFRHADRDHCWLMVLPLMEQMPRSFTFPPTPLASIQFIVWSLIGILHLLRTPLYWPDCGLVAIAVSIAAGAWFGLDIMIDTLIITAFLSLVFAKGIELVSGGKTRSSRAVLPLSKRDGLDEVPVSHLRRFISPWSSVGQYHTTKEGKYVVAS